jgi:hypothetical protein
VNKGFIISTDSFLGLTLMAFIILIAIFYISIISLDSWNSIDLINTSRDEIALLEKNNVLKNSITQASNELIIEKLNETTQNICFEVSIYEYGNTFPDLIAKKSGCVKNTDELFIVNRSFVTDTNFYTAKIESWYK